MKRTKTDKRTLKLNKDTVRQLVRPLDDNELRNVVGGGGTIANCQTRLEGDDY